jgi:DNA transformation protein
MLEALPNIGNAIAADLRAIGIETPEQLAQRDPLQTYYLLAEQMGPRHDPCVLYTLLAVQHYLNSDEKLPWWNFTDQGKRLLNSDDTQAPA